MTTETRNDSPPTERANRAWEDGLRAMIDGYGRQSAQLASGLWGLRLDQEQVSSALERIAEGTREVAAAQMAIMQEWLQAPFWFTGLTSPRELQTSYGRLWESYNRLFAAYVSAMVPAQEAATQATRRAADTTRQVIDTQARTAAKVARDVADAQEATTEAVVAANRRASRATARAVEQAMEVAEEASTRAESELTKTADSLADSARRTEALPATGERLIKGNVSRDGEKIYHLPGQSSYERTQPEVTFASEEEAQAAGFRRAETPGAGRIKGHVSRDGERIYHLPGQANYERAEADALFESEEDAQAAGFGRHSGSPGEPDVARRPDGPGVSRAVGKA